MFSRKKRTKRELPPELIDRILDFLYDEPKALAACSLVARSWTTTSRYHRFSSVRLISNEDWAKLDSLIETSPAVIGYMRTVTIDVTGANSARWISVCTGFASLKHITMFGAIIPPWQSEAAAISSVAHKITSFTLNAAFVSRYDFWPTIRMFPNLVSLDPCGARYVTELGALLSSSLPCYSPPIASITVVTFGQEHILDDLCNPPYPLTFLSALDIRDVDIKRTHELQALADTYAGQITRLRLYVRAHSQLYSPNYISCFTNLRHLTFADLNPGPADRYKRSGFGKSFAWVGGAIAALKSPITHLIFEILVRQAAELNAVDWKIIDGLISTSEMLRSLVQVSVVFLRRLEGESRDPKGIAYPEIIRKLMPKTERMAILTIGSR